MNREVIFMKQFYILTAFGKDRPGIVADVSEVVAKSGGNIEDSRMALLGEHFTLMVLLTGNGIYEDLIIGTERLQNEKGLVIHLSTVERNKPYDDAVPANYEIRVFGEDREGIVARITRILSTNAINIVSLKSKIEPAPISGTPIFTLSAELVAPPSADMKKLRDVMADIEDEMNLEIAISRIID